MASSRMPPSWACHHLREVAEHDAHARLVGDGLVVRAVARRALGEPRERRVLVLGAHDAADARRRLLEQLVQQKGAEEA
eukprot:2505952-Prymnesium_polylepis.1